MRLAAAACLLAFLIVANVSAESAAILRGTVSSSHTGKAIAGAVIRVESGAAAASTKTDRRGFFSLMGLPPGPARMQVTADGYTPVLFDICIQPNVTRTLPLVLTPGGSLPQMMNAQKHDERAATALNGDITSDVYTIGTC